MKKFPKLKKYQIVWIILASVVTALALTAGIWFIVASVNSSDNGNDDMTYNIVIADYTELLADRTISLNPELQDLNGKYVSGRFRYEYKNDNIFIDQDGIVTVLTPFNGEVSVKIIDDKTGATKDVVIRVVAELSDVLEIQDTEGIKLSGEESVKMEIGESYTFNVVTLPAAADVEEFFTLLAKDKDGNGKHIFDVAIEDNKVTLTAVGLGNGSVSLSLKNSNRNLNYEINVPFEIDFPDEALSASVHEACGKDLISYEELALVEKIVLPSEVSELSFEKSDLLRGLKTVVFTSEELVKTDLSYLKSGLTYRVKSEALYVEYVNDAEWGSVKSNIYPYITDYNKPVIVYHNDSTYTLSGMGWLGGAFENQDSKVYNYISETSPALKTVEVEAETEAISYSLTGYNFAGWKDLSGSTFANEDIDKITEGIHVNASWIAKTYTVTLDALHIDGTENKTVTVTYNSPVSLLPEGVKAGWNFAGWYTDKEYTNAVNSDMIYMMSDNATLYAKYTSALTLDYLRIDAGTENKVVDIVYGKPIGDVLDSLSISQSVAMSVGGWTFDKDAWSSSLLYKDNEKYNSSTPYLREGEGIAHILYAKYVREVTLNASSLASEVPENIILVYGRTVDESLAIYGRGSLASIIPTLNANSGWTFIGWTTTALSETPTTQLVFNENMLLKGDNTDTLSSMLHKQFYAVYKSTVTYSYGPASTAAGEFKRDLYYGMAFVLPELSEVAAVNDFVGYSFVGWYNSVGAKINDSTAGNHYRVDESYAGRTYIAKYHALPFKISYRHNGVILTDSEYVGHVYYDVGSNPDDNVINDAEIAIGRNVNLPAVPTVLGHTVKWVIKTESGIPVGGIFPNVVPAALKCDITYEAVCTPNTYYVIFNTHGVDTLESKPVVFGSALGTLPTPKTPLNYTFRGWYTDTTYQTPVSEDDLYSVDENTVIFAKYEMTVEFDNGFGNTEQKTFIYNSKASFEKLSDAHEWTFAGWYYIKDGVEHKYLGTSESFDIANYKDSNRKYISRWTRNIELVLGEGFSVQNSIITVIRGKTLAEANIILPSDFDITKMGDSALWELVRWYYIVGDERITAADSIVENLAVTKLYAEYKSTVTVVIDHEKDDQEAKKYEIVIILTSDKDSENVIFPTLNENYREELLAFEDDGYYHNEWEIDGVKYNKNAVGTMLDNHSYLW